MANHHIVVIEDDEDLRETLRELLEMEGFQVSTACNGLEGLRLIERSSRPCLILLDLMMPVMDGWEFLDTLRQNAAQLAQAPVAVVSAAADLSDVERQ